MSEGPIFYVDVSEIRAGKLDDVRAAMADLARFVDEKEPQLTSYGFYLDEEGGHMTVVAVHPDSASLEFHMDIGGPEFRKFAGLIELQKIEVYGAVSDAALERLARKAQELGSGTVTVHRREAGFTRA